MALKTTQDTKDTSQNMDPRRSSINQQVNKKIKFTKKKYNYRPNETCTTVMMNPTIIQSVSHIQPYPTVYPLAYPPAAPMQIVTTMTSYVPPPPLVSGYRYPDATWNTVVPVPTIPAQNLTYTMPATLYSPGPPPICPYTGVLPSPVLPSYPMLSPVTASVAPVDYLNQSIDSAFYEQTGAVPTFPEEAAYTHMAYDKKVRTSPVRSRDQFKPLNLEEYLVLPKDLFPSARTLAVNPNPIIHAFCREVDIEKHSSWILDLEFGVPRQPVTRPIATYDVQLNSIHCKNTPEAIHPGFESCSSDFKKTFLFYYDCSVSSWYKGFIITNSDRSVANFQSWLQVPMQKFGMCWP